MAVACFTVTALAFVFTSELVAALVCVAALIATLFVLWALTGSGRGRTRLRIGATVVGTLGTILAFTVGAIGAEDAAAVRWGVDTQAIVNRTWTTGSGSKTQYHCTLKHRDGTPIRHELRTNCEGYDSGDPIDVVADPKDRFGPVEGWKSDLPVKTEAEVAGGGALVLLLAIWLSAPAQPLRNRSGGRPSAVRTPRK